MNAFRQDSSRQEQQVQWQESQQEASQDTLRDFARQNEALKLEYQQCLQVQAQAFEAQQHRSSELIEDVREARKTNDSLKDENLELLAVQHQHCQGHWHPADETILQNQAEASLSSSATSSSASASCKGGSSPVQAWPVPKPGVLGLCHDFWSPAGKALDEDEEAIDKERQRLKRVRAAKAHPEEEADELHQFTSKEIEESPSRDKEKMPRVHQEAHTDESQAVKDPHAALLEKKKINSLSVIARGAEASPLKFDAFPTAPQMSKWRTDFLYKCAAAHPNPMVAFEWASEIEKKQEVMMSWLRMVPNTTQMSQPWKRRL